MSLPISSVPIEKWGRDHWSVLAYVETVCVDYRGRPCLQRMRCSRELHPGLAHSVDGAGIPTRLAGGETISNHDDWSCVEDMVSAGLVEWHGTGVNPVLKLTDKGWEIAHRFRRVLAAGGNSCTFKLVV